MTVRVGDRYALYFMPVLAFIAGCAVAAPAGQHAGRIEIKCADAAGPAVCEVAGRVGAGFVTVTIYDPQAARRQGGRGPAQSAVIHSASGWIADAAGHVVTAAHIARDRRFGARIRTVDGRLREAVILAVTPDRELALLKMEPFPGIAPGVLSPRDAPAANETIFAIGAPEGKAGVVSPGTVLEPAVPRRIVYDGYGFADAVRMAIAVEPGDSGGPVFDLEGRVTGMVAAFLLRETGDGESATGYAVSAGSIRTWLAEQPSD